MPAKKAAQEETKEPEQEMDVAPIPTITNVVTHAEAPVSANIKLYTPGGRDIILTVRSGSTEQEVNNVLDVLMKGVQHGIKEHGLLEVFASVSAPAQTQTARTPASVPGNQTAAPPTAPPVQGNAPGITSLTFQTQSLIAETKDGNRYWKIKGVPFMKFGVRIWDEVLAEAGFALDQMTDDVYTLPGYTAHYVEREPGKPQKVVKLVEN